MTWILDHLGDIGDLAVRHAILSALPLLIGLAISIPLGWLATLNSAVTPVVLAGTGLLYTIPSLALFVLMPLVLGTRILDPVNVVVAMTVYTVALLVRTVVDGLSAVPGHVDAAAEAMGLGRVRRLLTVQLPLAVPVIGAGLRVAAVSNVSIVSVASLIGTAQLGNLLVDGYNRNIPGELWAGVVGCLLLALLFDAAIIGLTRAMTPWRRSAPSTPGSRA